jgi:hypothetical protein
MSFMLFMVSFSVRQEKAWNRSFSVLRRWLSAGKFERTPLNSMACFTMKGMKSMKISNASLHVLHALHGELFGCARKRLETGRFSVPQRRWLSAGELGRTLAEFHGLFLP